jgi:DNA repair ATPase RecN
MEVQERLVKRLEEIGPNDYVFRKTSSKSVHGNCTRSLNRLIKRLGLDEKYESNGFHKITSHILRAYFFTKAVRKHGENYAHRMTGHGGYLMQYDRMTEDEKLSMYLELEPDLVIYDQTKNQLEIKRLKQEAESIKELREEVRKLREDRAKHDKKIVEDLWKKGVLPKNLSFFN